MSYFTSRVKRCFMLSEVLVYLTIQSKTAERPLWALAALGTGMGVEDPEASWVPGNGLLVSIAPHFQGDTYKMITHP